MYILLVEEDHVYASMIMGYLKKSGFTNIRHIDNGIDCLLQVYEEKTPDLMIMDSHLGRVNGVEVLQKLNTHKPGLRVIILKSQNNGTKISQSVQESAMDIITKDEQIFENLMPHVHRIHTEVVHHKRSRPVTNMLVNFKRFIFAP